MKLYQRNRIWYMTVNVDGRRVQESTGTTDRRKAERFSALRFAEIERGEQSRSKTITLAQLGEQYMEYARVKNARGSVTNR
jgi:hypothetical protein